MTTHKTRVAWVRQPESVRRYGRLLTSLPQAVCECGWKGEVKDRWDYASGEAISHFEDNRAPVRRTMFGLQLTLRLGEWHTADDAWFIGRVREITTCDGAPHPYNYRDYITGQKMQAYCDGGDEHDRECGWSIYSGRGIDGCGDLLPSLTDAWRELARSLVPAGGGGATPSPSLS